MKYSDLVAELAERDKLKPSDLFDESNTHWETDEDGARFLVCDDSFEELAKEYNLSENVVFDMFCQYSDDSKSLVDFVTEREEARKGQY